MEQDSRNKALNTSRHDRKKNAHKRRTSLLPHVKNKTRSTTSKILSLPRILGKTSFKKKEEVKKIIQPPPSNPSQDERRS